MPNYNDTQTSQLIINKLTKTQFNNAGNLDPTQSYEVDPEFNGGKLLATDEDGDIVESAIPSNVSIPSKTSDLTNDSGYQANVLEGVQVNGSDLTITNKKVNVPVPTVNNPTITITQGGVTKGSFALNQSSGDTIALDAGGAPDYSSTLSNVGNNYTAPSDGIFWFSVGNSNTARNILITPAGGTEIQYTDVINSYGVAGGYQVYLAKGDTIIITNAGTGLESSYFIPLKGV